MTSVQQPVMTSKEYPYLTTRGSKTEINNTGLWTSKSDEGIAAVVDTILEHRKKLRQNATSRMYKTTFTPKEERKKRSREEAPLEGIK